MEDTYTYTARSVENPEQVVTFTLHDHSMSVGLGAPLEQISRVLDAASPEPEAEGEEAGRPRLWLRPLAVSLVERGTRPFRVRDVYASTDEDWLRVSAWYRAGGLALAPVTLIEGQVDNAEAAEAFVQELETRKDEVGGAPGVLNLLDFWATWAVAGLAMFGLLQAWRRKGAS